MLTPLTAGGKTPLKKGCPGYHMMEFSRVRLRCVSN